MKAAVIYYSQSGTTKKIAKKIQAKYNADMYFVEPEEAYGNFVSSVAKVIGEKVKKKRPEFKTQVADFSSYDMVFIGFPVWAGTLPQFLQEYIRRADLEGKRVIPFATAGGTGKESAYKTLQELLPSSAISDYFFTSKAQKADPDAWLNGIK